jgi:hypothetical protein
MSTSYEVVPVCDKLYELVSVVQGKTWTLESTNPFTLGTTDHDFINFVCQGTLDYCESIKIKLENSNEL